MTGQRVYPNKEGHLWLKEGEYGKDSDGVWSIRTPNGLCGCLINHSVIEHEDGTITVSPSILVSNGEGGKSYHGYLEKGIWREV